MTTRQGADLTGTAPADHSIVTGANRRTLDAIFRHPLAHNLVWTDVVALLTKIGEVDERANSEFSLRVNGEHFLMRKPRNKDLESPEVLGLRHFLAKAGWSPALPPLQAVHATTTNLMVVVDHHGARVFHVDVSADDAAEHIIRPYDPHHFLHHLAHKDQSRERGSGRRRITASMKRSPRPSPRRAESSWSATPRARAMLPIT
jgi:hypothetical protein